MARARKVRGIQPKKSLTDNARLIIEVRLDELLSWRHALDDPDAVQDLHNMRIAAKRLRYAFEIFEPCFSGIKPLLKKLTQMQEDLGTIHDLDVLTAILRGRLAVVDRALEEGVIEIMDGEGTAIDKSNRLRKFLGAQMREPRRLGTIALIGDKVAERRRRFISFRDTWHGAPLQEFARQVEHVAGLHHRKPDDSHHDHVRNESADSIEPPVLLSAQGVPFESSSAEPPGKSGSAESEADLSRR